LHLAGQEICFEKHSPLLKVKLKWPFLKCTPIARFTELLLSYIIQ
jgi:hypothetical protein